MNPILKTFLLQELAAGERGLLELEENFKPTVDLRVFAEPALTDEMLLRFVADNDAPQADAISQVFPPGGHRIRRRRKT
jgi:hypothetical protein